MRLLASHIASPLQPAYATEAAAAAATAEAAAADASEGSDGEDSPYPPPLPPEALESSRRESTGALVQLQAGFMLGEGVDDTELAALSLRSGASSRGPPVTLPGPRGSRSRRPSGDLHETALL